jgi:hypothetical protein
MSQKHAERLTGINQRTIGRWMNGESIPNKPADVAKFAQGFKVNILEAFVQAGMLTEQEAAMPPPMRPDPATIDDGDLVKELRRRLDQRTALLARVDGLSPTGPREETPEPSLHLVVEEPPTKVGGPSAARREQEKSDSRDPRPH